MDAVEEESVVTCSGTQSTHDARNKCQHDRAERTNDARRMAKGEWTSYSRVRIDRKIMR